MKRPPDLQEKRDKTTLRSCGGQVLQAGAGKEVGAFPAFEGGEGVGDGLPRSLLLSCGGFPEEGLELGQGHLGGVDVVGVGREK